MATITARRQVNGSIRYTAIVCKRVGKTIVHREAKTFTHRSAALSWARHREVELENPAALTQTRHATITLAELIRWYIDTFETISKWQRSKQTHLEFLERHSNCPSAACSWGRAVEDDDFLVDTWVWHLAARVDGLPPLAGGITHAGSKTVNSPVCLLNCASNRQFGEPLWHGDLQIDLQPGADGGIHQSIEAELVNLPFQ